MPRRAPHFLFGKKMGEKNREGSGAPRRSPSNPSDGALRPFFPSSALLAGLTALRAANRRLTGETLEKPRSKAQLFKRFCAKEDACALSPISPFLSLLAGLAALRPQTAGWHGKRPKSQGAELSFSDVSVRWGCAGAFAWLGFLPGAGNRSQDFCLLGKTEAVRGHTPGKNRVRARHGEERDTVRDLLAAGALEKPRSRAQFFGRFCALGMRRGFRPAGFLPAEGNRSQAFSLSGKTEARRGHTPGKNRVRARNGEEKDRVRVLLTAAARACEARRRKRRGKPLCGHPPHKKLHRG